MQYQALAVKDCQTRAEMLATYRAAKKSFLVNRLANPAPLPKELPPEPPSLPTSSPVSEFPRHMAAIMTLQSADEVRLPARDIMSAVALAHGISMADMKGHRRSSRFVAARHHAIALISQYRPDLSYPVIGLLMNRDHSTIIHGKRHWPKIAGKFRLQATQIQNMLGIRWSPELRENIQSGENLQNSLCTENIKIA